MMYNDHSHQCTYCGELYPCPLDKRDCEMPWKTTHNDHYIALMEQ